MIESIGLSNCCALLWGIGLLLIRPVQTKKESSSRGSSPRVSLSVSRWTLTGALSSIDYQARSVQLVTRGGLQSTFPLVSFTLVLPERYHQHGALYYSVGVKEAYSFETRDITAVGGRKLFCTLTMRPTLAGLLSEHS